MTNVSTVGAHSDGRRIHYGRFYGLADDPGDGRPLVAVTGNCQAGSIRRLLESTGHADAVLIPPVHELTVGDMPYLARILRRARVLVAQPVRDGYRGLPIGWREQAALLPAGATVVRYPVLRWAGLHPWHVIVRPPSDPGAVPPLVPYHDLRVLLDRPLSDAPAPAIRRAAAESIAALRLREDHHGTVRASDLLARTPRWHTINHPDNATLMEVARRVAEAAGIGGDVADPGREMLGGVRARVDDAAAAALGVEPDPPGDPWIVDGRGIGAGELRRAHRAWYREHPDAVAEGRRRHAGLIDLLTGGRP